MKCKSKQKFQRFIEGKLIVYNDDEEQKRKQKKSYHVNQGKPEVRHSGSPYIDSNLLMENSKKKDLSY